MAVPFNIKYQSSCVSARQLSERNRRVSNARSQFVCSTFRNFFGTNNPSLSSRSALNVRYIEAANQAEHSYVPPPPPVGAPPVGGVQRHASHNNGLPLAGPTRSRDESYSSTSTTPVMKSNAPAIFSVSVDETRSGDYATSPITIEDSVGGGGNVPLSKDSRMNDRYTKHVVVDPSRMGLLAVDSKLNQRYA